MRAVRPRVATRKPDRAVLHFLPPWLRGAIALTLLILNTLFWCTPLFALALVKLLLPFAAARRTIDPVLNAIAGRWIAGNGIWMRLVQRGDWDVAGLEPFVPNGWYLVTCNHQSWADIFVLQRLLNGRIPMLKFFLKQELIWVPVIGTAWWALDFRSCAAIRMPTCSSTRKSGSRTSKPPAAPARSSRWCRPA